MKYNKVEGSANTDDYNLFIRNYSNCELMVNILDYIHSLHKKVNT